MSKSEVYYFLCRCSCGRLIEVPCEDVLNGKVTSCGYCSKESGKKLSRKPGKENISKLSTEDQRIPDPGSWQDVD